MTKKQNDLKQSERGERSDHSPTPWKVKDGKMSMLGDSTQPIVAKDGIIFAFVSDENLKDDSRQQANAAFIVQACNAHEALVEALKNVRVLFKEGITTEMIDAALKLAGENGESI